jgi:DNA-3-methyladenine glycosylase
MERLKPPRDAKAVDGSARLLRPFYARDPRRVAKDLLGKVLVHVDGGVRRAARIVETEAYRGQEDQASHARFGPTRRAGIMFGPPGVAYVYLVYGLSHCFNVVTGVDGLASAVLVRAGEPVEGCLHATTGPGNLCRALALRRDTHNGLDLTGDLLFIQAAECAEGAPCPAERILASPRVNVGFAGSWADKPWRFSLEGNRFVSKPWPTPRSTSRPRAR